MYNRKGIFFRVVCLPGLRKRRTRFSVFGGRVARYSNGANQNKDSHQLPSGGEREYSRMSSGHSRPRTGVSDVLVLRRMRECREAQGCAGATTPAGKEGVRAVTGRQATKQAQFPGV